MEYFHISVFYPPPEGLGGLQNKNSHHQGSRGFQKIKPPTRTRRSPMKGGGYYVIITIFERNLQTALCTEIYKYGQNLAITLPPKSLPMPISVYVIKHAC